jgi:hypothetical protein
MRHVGFLLLTIVTALGLSSCQSQSEDVSSDADSGLQCIQPGSIRAHIRFLADDLLEGRESGTRGYDLAAKYVAATLEAMGLQPAGLEGTYFQNVMFRTATAEPSRSSLTLLRDGWKKTLRGGEDYVLSPDFLRQDLRVQAPLVFVGFGITAPELDYDDYAGIDAKGKIVVTLFGAPASFPNDQRAHYSGRPKLENAIAHGAVGILNFILPSDDQRAPWPLIVRLIKRTGMKWIDDAGNLSSTWPEIRGYGLLSRETAEEVFSSAPMSLQEVFSAAESGKLEAFDIPMEAELVTVATHGESQSPNVIATLQGSDANLRDEYVVYSAHLDHDGLGEPVDGDNIYNGAYDNASGTAVLLEIARAFTCLPEPPKRSVLFLGTTAEEKGLLGADFFAQHPTVPLDSIVANINLDGALMLYPIRDLVVFGAEHSSLGETFQLAAERVGLVLSPDPMPEEVLFVRSDQYPFVRQGVPAAFAIAGLQSTDPGVDGMALTREWMTTIYHTPKDDLSQDMDFESGATYAGVNFLAGYLVAQENERPTWNEGDFFGEKFGSKGKSSSP